jgi:hypothetical protein
MSFLQFMSAYGNNGEATVSGGKRRATRFQPDIRGEEHHKMNTLVSGHHSPSFHSSGGSFDGPASGPNVHYDYM